MDYKEKYLKYKTKYLKLKGKGRDRFNRFDGILLNSDKYRYNYEIYCFYEADNDVLIDKVNNFIDNTLVLNEYFSDLFKLNSRVKYFKEILDNCDYLNTTLPYINDEIIEEKANRDYYIREADIVFTRDFKNHVEILYQYIFQDNSGPLSTFSKLLFHLGVYNVSDTIFYSGKYSRSNFINGFSDGIYKDKKTTIVKEFPDDKYDILKNAFHLTYVFKLYYQYLVGDMIAQGFTNKYTIYRCHRTSSFMFDLNIGDEIKYALPTSWSYSTYMQYYWCADYNLSGLLLKCNVPAWMIMPLTLPKKTHELFEPDIIDKMDKNIDEREFLLYPCILKITNIYYEPLINKYVYEVDLEPDRAKLIKFVDETFNLLYGFKNFRSDPDYELYKKLYDAINKINNAGQIDYLLKLKGENEYECKIIDDVIQLIKDANKLCIDFENNILIPKIESCINEEELNDLKRRIKDCLFQ